MACLEGPTANRSSLMIARLVGLSAVSLPYGFLGGMVLGGLTTAAKKRLDPTRNPILEPPNHDFSSSFPSR